VSVEFKNDSNLGRGSFIAVLVRKHRVGRIEKNRLGKWCYFSEPNELNSELENSDLEALKKAVVARL
jgi:hypothetical protein